MDLLWWFVCGLLFTVVWCAIAVGLACWFLGVDDVCVCLWIWFGLVYLWFCLLSCWLFFALWVWCVLRFFALLLILICQGWSCWFVWSLLGGCCWRSTLWFLVKLLIRCWLSVFRFTFVTWTSVVWFVDWCLRLLFVTSLLVDLYLLVKAGYLLPPVQDFVCDLRLL